MDLTLSPAGARAPGARQRRDRRAAAARGRVRAGGRLAVGRAGPRASSGGRRSRRTSTAARCRGALGGQGWTAPRGGRSSTSSSARSPADCGRTSRAPTTRSSTTDPESRRYLDRRCAASGPVRTRSPRTRRVGRARARGDGRPDPSTGDYVLNGEKWFVTGPDDTDFMIFHGNVATATSACRPCSSSTTTRPASAWHDPDYMHTFADRHPSSSSRTCASRPARSSAGSAGPTI